MNVIPELRSNKYVCTKLDIYVLWDSAGIIKLSNFKSNLYPSDKVLIISISINVCMLYRHGNELMS